MKIDLTYVVSSNLFKFLYGSKTIKSSKEL